MKYSKVFITAIGYELGPVVVTSSELEKRVLPMLEALHIPPGQLEALTGIRERRWWDEGFPLSEGAARAGRKALEQAGLRPSDIGALVYAGVCRENSEPATATAVAALLGTGPETAVYDLSNACLGVQNGMLDIANRIELGQIRAGLVVSCESAREINESMIAAMLKDRGFENFRLSIATLTGGSGAVGVVLTDGSFAGTHRRHRLLGGVYRAACEHHDLCVWHRDHMRTDATATLKNGVALGRQTWDALLKDLGMKAGDFDRTVCHQVGSAHRRGILQALGIPEEKDFPAFEYLGNMGTAALPTAAAIADEREFLRPGDKVAFLGIGSGLNTIMMGLEW
ncbi:MAG: 3-oxoacyl-acyl-carrier-protein synthase III [Elusimicrobia bacterium]|nr:MAG: 3-oxoacyl-acyl-carrier-protein synthase III [Elusimicrobiota bacterium]KAF0154175.1 MAG: 3-oxoacyl-acyl-carrier-protein synthase III [Elusimicrobiota bacterium]